MRVFVVVFGLRQLYFRRNSVLNFHSTWVRFVSFSQRWTSFVRLTEKEEEEEKDNKKDNNNKQKKTKEKRQKKRRVIPAVNRA